LSKRKKTPLAATGGVFLCAYFIELLSKSIVPLKRVSVKNIVIVLFFSSVHQPLLDTPSIFDTIVQN